MTFDFICNNQCLDTSVNDIIVCREKMADRMDVDFAPP